MQWRKEQQTKENEKEATTTKGRKPSQYETIIFYHGELLVGKSNLEKDMEREGKQENVWIHYYEQIAKVLILRYFQEQKWIAVWILLTLTQYINYAQHFGRNEAEKRNKRKEEKWSGEGESRRIQNNLTKEQQEQHVGSLGSPQ